MRVCLSARRNSRSPILAAAARLTREVDAIADSILRHRRACCHQQMVMTAKGVDGDMLSDGHYINFAAPGSGAAPPPATSRQLYAQCSCAMYGDIAECYLCDVSAPILF